jgi:predicted phosphodiesterase
MRYGLIADVHANAHALDAALAFLSTQALDRYLCAGDLVDSLSTRNHR